MQFADRENIYLEGLPANFPEGTIYVHTEPETRTESRFGFPERSNEIPEGSDDRETIKILEKAGVDKGLILNPESILVYDSDGLIDTIDRCGY